MKVLKICIGTWQNASHDKRELSVCRELGADVLVAAKGDLTGQKEMVDGFPVIRLSARPLGNKVPVAINRVVSLFTWASYIRKMKDVDVISGHDLSGLLIGWLSNFFKRNKAKLVYDSHEFELARSADRSKLLLFFIKTGERFLMKRSVLSTMVSDSIADEVQRIHKLPVRPTVARNTPYYWELNEARIVETRKEILSALGLSSDTFLVMFHGYYRPHNGIEPMLEAVSRIPGTAAVLVGNSDECRKAELQELCRKWGMEDRCYFHPAVPVEELYRFVGAADLGTALLPPITANYTWALPNKLFENIQSMTPVLVSDFPEMGKIVESYCIGLKVDPEDIDAITAAIRTMKDDKAFYAACKENIRSAKEELCWEKEKEKLKAAYKAILT